jgi:dCTP diphosphatase
MSSTDFIQLKHRLRDFAKARDWEQFHSPKNLSMALSAEVAEIMNTFNG